jgi:CubicO group peptidase (beta-lactamase class C family)
MRNRSFAFILYLPVMLAGMTAFGQQAGPQQTDPLPRSIPEKEGVSSAGILGFVNAIERTRNEFHSVMVLRHGKVIAEGWWNPYQPDLKQSLYSVSKSFTSTAVGFAVSEGLLSVEDKVLSFFPHDLPATVTPYLAGLTVKNLLCMLEGQDPDPTMAIASADSNWIRGFLATPILNKPGDHFLYNSMGVYILAAIVERRTGQHLVDYLKPRLFEPLGIRGEDWELSPQGISTGGWGLRLRTEDMAKMGQLYLQKGNWKGRQLLPAQWVADATAAYNDEGPTWAQRTVRDSSDWRQGYGYLFWRCRHHAFRADGAFGQLIVVMPDEDAVVAVTCETHDMQDEVNLIWNWLLPAMHKGSLPEDELAAAALQRKLAALALPLPVGRTRSPSEALISGKTFIIKDNEEKIASMVFRFNAGTGQSAGTGQLDIERDGVMTHATLGAGRWMNGETMFPSPNVVGPQIAALAPFRVAGSYDWKDEHTLEIVLRYIESPHTETILCHFYGNKLSASVERSMNFGSKRSALEGETK